jgi:hypothetical protein
VLSSASCAAAPLSSPSSDTEGRRPPRALYLKGRAGDAADVVLSAVGHNFRCILA